MKKLVFTTLAALLCISLFACGQKNADAKETGSGKPSASFADTDSANHGADTDKAHTDGTGGEAGNDEGTSATVRQIADAVDTSGLFGDSMELYVKGDEYAADILEFTYGINESEHHIADYVISEQTSKQAYTFAYIVFDDGFETSDFDAVSKALEEVYLADLKAALEVYNPDAYRMCDNAEIKLWQSCTELDDGTTDRIHSVTFMISDSNSAAEDKVLPTTAESTRVSVD